MVPLMATAKQLKARALFARRARSGAFKRVYTTPGQMTIEEHRKAIDDLNRRYQSRAKPRKTRKDKGVRRPRFSDAPGAAQKRRVAPPPSTINSPVPPVLTPIDVNKIFDSAPFGTPEQFFQFLGQNALGLKRFFMK